MVQKPFFILFVILIQLSGLTGCKIDRKKAIDRDKFSFKVSDDSFLFFKNVRQIYYDIQEIPQAHWHAYRFGDRAQSNVRPILTPVIVVDWMKNESYILLEPNEVLQSENILVIQEKNSQGKTFEYSLGERGRENMLEFATKIYEGIMDENEITIRANGVDEPLFASVGERDAFRITMADYYRLTRVF